jgi:hypothetical protein
MASSGRFIGQSFIEISHGPCKRTRQRLSGSCEGIVLAVDIGGHREAGRGTAEPLRDDGWGHSPEMHPGPACVEHRGAGSPGAQRSWPTWRTGPHTTRAGPGDPTRPPRCEPPSSYRSRWRPPRPPAAPVPVWPQRSQRGSQALVQRQRASSPLGLGLTLHNFAIDHGPGEPDRDRPSVKIDISSGAQAPRHVGGPYRLSWNAA